MIQWSIIWRKNIFAQWFAQRLVDSGIFEGEIWKKPTTWVWNFVCWKCRRKSRSSIFFSFSGKGTKQTHLWTSEKSSKNFLFGTASLTGTTSETQKAHYFIQICEGFVERLVDRVKYSMLFGYQSISMVFVLPNLLFTVQLLSNYDQLTRICSHERPQFVHVITN